MSDDDKEDKTEEPSEKRKGELRKEGKVAQSHDVVSAAALIAGAAALSSTTGMLAVDLTGLLLRCLRLVDVNDPLAAVRASASTLTGLLPALVAAQVGAIVAGLAQTGGLFSIESVMPKGERLDPMGKLKQLLPGKEMATELGKSLLKIGAVSIVMYQVLDDALPTLLSLGMEDARVGASTVGGIAIKVIMYAAGAFAAIAALDFVMAKKRFNEDARMSKQELKEEFKQEEQDPAMKRKMRQRAREILAQAKVGDLKTATVLVTNPTHYAVALRYDPDKDAVPMVINKATDAAALRMRTQCRGYRIPIIENRPLARSLHKRGKIGKPIPTEMYRAVAEIIAQVMRLRLGARK
jgi:flagellar biosynthesis protein FlhB